MPQIKGTRVYWKKSTSDVGTKPKQILKNCAYVSVVLRSVQYKADGSFWQKLFGGSDKITVSTQVIWQSGGDSKTAASIQDFRKISVPSVNALAIGRNIALKVPAVADGLEMQVSISALKDDNLGKTLQILNGDDFKKPLELAPVAVGQILTITNLVKRVFTDVEPSQVLMASYPGIISDGEIPDPVLNNRLVDGYIILIVKQDEEDQLDFDPNGLSVEGDALLFNKKPIPNTYMVYQVSSEAIRGRDTGSGWSKKFVQASSKADELLFATPDQRQGIISAAYDLLKEGGALIDNDENYLILEKTKWKKAAYVEVTDKINANTRGQSPTPPGASVAARSLGIAMKGEDREITDDGLRGEVRAFADELAKAGLSSGFTSCLPVVATRTSKRKSVAR